MDELYTNYTILSQWAVSSFIDLSYVIGIRWNLKAISLITKSINYFYKFSQPFEFLSLNILWLYLHAIINWEIGIDI